MKRLDRDRGDAPGRPRRAVTRRPAARLRGRLTARAGVSLLEVLVAAVVLAIGLVGVGSMVTYGVISHKKAAHYSIAANRATAELERIRDGGYLSAQVTSTFFPSPTYTVLNATQVGFTMSDLPEGQGVITLHEDVEAQATNPATGSPYLNMKAASVHITWGGSRTTRGSYDTSTLIANRP